ncbi:hypothetical protein CTRI78_v003086 [Colletotrichum trifolii]|uniref:Uncharacterized protein n=1 Tax=Colletotrichum trifolii TaxID=5466 RepID=A0A4R8RSU1_COLTR|nr:hypothetical protein CTRI78_v003086 [Colletotrichum trifolii]
MRFSIAFVLAVLQVSLVSAEIVLRKCGTPSPAEWVSNCSEKDKGGCATVCSQKCRTGEGKFMANGAKCDCYCKPLV